VLIQTGQSGRGQRETRAEAEDRAALIDPLPREIDSWTGVQDMRDRIRHELGDWRPTPGDFISIPRRSTLHGHLRFVGSHTVVADGRGEWIVTRARDGFAVGPVFVAGAYG